MENSSRLVWGKGGVAGDPVVLLEEHLGISGRSPEQYALMGLLRNDEFSRLVSLSRSIDFAFAICGSRAETPQGLRNRNRQQSMSKEERGYYFPEYRRNGIPALTDVDLWFCQKNKIENGVLLSLMKQVSVIFNVNENDVDFGYAPSENNMATHFEESDLCPMTRKGDRRGAPGGIVFDRGDTRRYYSFWHYLSL